MKVAGFGFGFWDSIYTCVFYWFNGFGISGKVLCAIGFGVVLVLAMDHWVIGLYVRGNKGIGWGYRLSVLFAVGNIY